VAVTSESSTPPETATVPRLRACTLAPLRLPELLSTPSRPAALIEPLMSAEVTRASSPARDVIDAPRSPVPKNSTRPMLSADRSSCHVPPVTLTRPSRPPTSTRGAGPPLSVIEPFLTRSTSREPSVTLRSPARSS